jgi:hypothetical protein
MSAIVTPNRQRALLGLPRVRPQVLIPRGSLLEWRDQQGASSLQE